MLIPYRTDAPLYHWPWMTLLLVLVNIATFVITGGGTQIDGWLLQFGNGLHPHEWVANLFLHFGFMHLVGNLFFLWAFGIIVEGKVGWWKFLLIYLGIGITESFITQFLMLQSSSSSGAGGASGVIFGLLAISLIWAPKNEIHCLWLVIGLFGTFCEISIIVFAGIYFGFELLLAFLSISSGGFISSAILHLLGAFLGMIVGVVLLKLRAVDCENWDLFSVISGKNRNTYR